MTAWRRISSWIPIASAPYTLSAPNRSALEWNACTLSVRVMQGRSASRAKSAA